MHLFWQEKNLFIKKRKFIFSEKIKKAFVFNGTPTVLTNTLIFIDEFPYSLFCKNTLVTKDGCIINEYDKTDQSNEEQYNEIINCCFDKFIYFQNKNKVFLLEHKFSKPEFLFVCRSNLLEVTDKYFLLGGGKRLFIKEKNTDTILEILFNDNEVIFQSVYYNEIDDNAPYIGSLFLKINNFLVFYDEKSVFLLNGNDLSVNHLKIKLKRIELAKLNNKNYLLLNDQLYDGINIIRSNVSVDDKFSFFNLEDKNVCQNFVKIKQSEIEIFERKLAKSPSPYNFIKQNIKNLNDQFYVQKLKEYYLIDKIEEEEKDDIQKIPSPADLQDYLSNFDPTVITNLKSKNNEKFIKNFNNEKLNFYEIFSQNLTTSDQNENLTKTTALKKSFCIKSDIQIREKLFKEPPNIKHVEKISSLNLENLDSKTKEALFLCFEPPKIFIQDENDFENKKLKFYKTKKSAQSPFILFSSLKPSFLTNNFNNAIVRILMIDSNDYIGMISERLGEGNSLTNSVLEEIEESEIYKVINNQMTEKKDYTSEEIGGLILGLGIRKSYHKIFNSENDFINSMSLIASSITNEEREDPALLNNLKINNLTLNTATVISLGFSFKCTNNSFIIDLLKKECNKYGCINKQWYDEIYRLISGYSIIMVHKKRYLNEIFSNYKVNYFIKLDDKLAELIVNGVLFWNSKDLKIIKKLKRNLNDRLEEIFYSELFIHGITNKKIKVPVLERGLTLHEIYKTAGKIFYLGIHSFLTNDCNEELYKKLKKECLMAEQEMIVNNEYKIIYDTYLITLCLIYNGTCDLKILKIFRRALNTNNSVRFNDFIFGRFETNYFLRYGDILRYKMCVGLLFCGLGRFHLKKDCLVELIYAFYINFPLSEDDQKMFLFFRHNLVNKFERKKNLIISDWSKNDKKILFDLFSNFYEERGENDLPLSTFIN